MKWRPEECGKITDDTGAFLGRANSDADAGNLCSDHNADIDALTAERDKWQEIAQGEVETNVELRDKLAELQRRLDAICNWIDTNNDNGAGEAIYAIAEGRHNE